MHVHRFTNGRHCSTNLQMLHKNKKKSAYIHRHRNTENIQELPSYCRGTGNWHGSDMSHATTTSPKPFFGGHLGGSATPRSEEEMLDGQHQRVDIPAHARTAYKGLLQKTLWVDLRWIVSHIHPTTQSIKGLNWSELSRDAFTIYDPRESCDHSWPKRQLRLLLSWCLMSVPINHVDW